ncbi:MAG TPA: glycoside hydrolase [Clostridiales bacterium]|nr:glycoside hydrolase [Clostridiales bacterium]
MSEKICPSHAENSNVKGFLHTRGQKIVNGSGDRILLTGWGLGNWLLPEGYMWLAGDGNRFDRPRRIEAVIRELTGPDYAAAFWKQYRENYVTREDIAFMADLGYNSVRIPINWRILMEEGPGCIWKEDGFARIDRCLDWCEEFKLYAFLDLHGAPGGQTGANIDDSIDDIPRLFTDEDSRTKCLELWKEIARRYRDRWIVGGYDLLNEPLSPVHGREYALNPLAPALSVFYEELIAEIRKTDTRHMLSMEGSQWATDPSIFFKKYDGNMVIHFHRYACKPGMEALQPFLEYSERLDQPLWLGETGENTLEWYTAMYPLCSSLGIGFNLWPWKKMDCTNSPCSVNKPEGWDEIIQYTHGAKHPGTERTRKILDEFLQNIRISHCRWNLDVTNAVFRRPDCSVRATDFNLVPGKGISCSGFRTEGNLYHYQTRTGMAIVAAEKQPVPRRFAFDSGWDLLALEMRQGEFATYSINEVPEGCTVRVELLCREPAQICFTQDSKTVRTFTPEPAMQPQTLFACRLSEAKRSLVKIHVLSGSLRFFRLIFQKD